jgi:hydrogenase/urease accessory protein HupE
VRHILTGYDHLVFLAGLLLAAGTARKLVVALTAFTVAHAVSLALVVIGGVHAPPSIVEPLIAASIAWVGVENLLRERRRATLLVVFGFGLIHGFGFAGALIELGFGKSVTDVATALLSFNGGVEAGQLAAAAAMAPLVWMIRRRPRWQAIQATGMRRVDRDGGRGWLLERCSVPNPSADFSAGHPVWRRCSSLTYSRYARSRALPAGRRLRQIVTAWTRDTSVASIGFS